MILGITGKSGTGKHTAAQFFEQRGWEVLDADRIARLLYRPYLRTWKAMVDHFGEGILTKDDQIDRQKLKKIVFGKTPEAKKALAELNVIIHPELIRHLNDEIFYLRKRKENVIVVGALWREIGLFGLCDKVLLIKSGDSVAYERVRKRDGIDQEAFESVMENQETPETPHLTIENEGSFQDFYKKLNSALTQL